MTDTALGQSFETPAIDPRWLRPAVIAAVVALHAAAIAFLPFLARQHQVETPQEVIVDIQPEPEAPLAPAPPPTAANAPVESPPPQQVVQPPLPPPEPPPAVQAQPERPPPVVEATPPVPEAPPSPTVADTPPPEPAPPPAPIELAPPKPPPASPRVEPPKARIKPTEKVEPKPERAEPRARETERRSEEAAKAVAAREERLREEPSSASRSEASAASKSAYVSAVAGAIRSRLFYPPAARARGAKGVVGVAFTIGSSGALSSFTITRSSGDGDLDAAARTLVQSTRFPPPPGGSIHVATSFNYVPR